MIIVSNCLHRVKVQDIKEVFNLAVNNTMGTKDVRIQAGNTYQACIFLLFFFCIWSEHPVKQNIKKRVGDSYLKVIKARLNASVENPRHWVKVVALKSKLTYVTGPNHLCP